MFGYYLDLALRSLRRNQALTVLMIVTIGFGVAASMTTWSVFRAVSGDPIPQKSAELFVPQIDNWGPAGHAPGSKSTEPPNAMDYTDAVALMRLAATTLGRDHFVWRGRTADPFAELFADNFRKPAPPVAAPVPMPAPPVAPPVAPPFAVPPAPPSG